MKNHFIAVLFIVYSSSFIVTKAAAQNSDTAAKPMHIGIMVSGGASLIQYYNNNYFNYLGELTNSYNSTYIQGYSNPKWASGDTIPNNFAWKKTSTAFNVGAGLEISGDELKWMHNIFEVNYMQTSGEYSYNLEYPEISYRLSSLTIHDSVRNSYVQNVFSLFYKFQPTYKCFFFSFEIGFNFNLIKVNEQKREWQDYASLDEFTGKTTYDTIYTIANSSKNGWYLNFPLQVGVGAYLKCKKLVFKPGFYFTDYFLKGYYAFNFSLDVVELIK
jgi:hypothetical protein